MSAPEFEPTPTAEHIDAVAREVRPHEHLVVDEETYWGLLYLHNELRRMLDSGALIHDRLVYLSADAERRLELTRQWNDADPGHHLREVAP